MDKQQKKIQKKKKSSETSEIEMESGNDREKSLYLEQIEYLRTEVERCQLRCDQLETDNNDLLCQCRKTEVDRKDICEYLQLANAAVERGVAELEEQLEAQRKEEREENEELTLQFNLEMKKLQEQVNALAAQNRRKAVRLEEQRVEVTQCLSNRKCVVDQMQRQEEQHEETIRLLTEEVAKEAENEEGNHPDVLAQIEMEVSARVEEERAQHREVLEEMRRLAGGNYPLLQETTALLDRRPLGGLQMERMQKGMDRMSRCVLRWEKEKERLTKRSEELEVQLENRRGRKQHALANQNAVRQHLASVSEEHRHKTAEVGELEAELQEERDRRRRLEGDMRTAAGLLRFIAENSGKTAGVERKRQRLREILKRPDGETPPTSDPEASRSESSSFTTDPLHLMARYRPGDFGFVPRPSWKRAGARTQNVQRPPNRRR
ncbi:cilia- and flagella-associated protein 157-like [Embiotoca jacksoni]|uniref:cilia- and flagella-associated protein 157-like n=1 Tax=Embiotoca jacksoni TaxID=100190 RepID=UPI0037048A5C